MGMRKNIVTHSEMPLVFKQESKMFKAKKKHRCKINLSGSGPKHCGRFKCYPDVSITLEVNNLGISCQTLWPSHIN